MNPATQGVRSQQKLNGQVSEDSDAKRAHQCHETKQWRSFEDGKQINFREKDREKNLSPQTRIMPINSSECLLQKKRSPLCQEG